MQRLLPIFAESFLVKFFRFFLRRGDKFADLNCSLNSSNSLNIEASEIAKAVSQIFRNVGLNFQNHRIKLLRSFLICQEHFRSLYHQEPCQFSHYLFKK